MDRVKNMRAVTTILGAGPAGLAAAITLAAAGRRVRVLEKRSRIGGRFHGDFQGLENWSHHDDVLTEFADHGLPARFPHRPFHDVNVLATDGSCTVLRSAEPLFYLVRRGPDPDTLDSALLEQARALGVDVAFDQTSACLHTGDIVATGPSRPNVTAIGYTFATDAADAAYAVIDPQLAPGGYGYLLIWNGRATVAACLFDDFHHEQRYLDQLMAFFQNRLALTVLQPKRFGGAGNFFSPLRLCDNGLLYAGEAAGLQDPLWGFGMRLAVHSGIAAAHAVLAGGSERYAEQATRHFRRAFQAGLVNRFVFQKLSQHTVGRLVRRLEQKPDIRAWLRRRYAGGWLHRMLSVWLAHSARTPPLATPAHACHCVLCQCFDSKQETLSCK